MEAFCRPVAGGVWETQLDSGFGRYTPCLVDGLVIPVAQLVLLGAAVQRMRALLYSPAPRFRLRSPWLAQAPLAVVAAFLVLEPLVQLALGMSTVVPAGGEGRGMPPSEVVGLVASAASWAAVLGVLALETRTYVRESVWGVRFGAVYALVAHGTKAQFSAAVREVMAPAAVGAYVGYLAAAGVAAALLLARFPALQEAPAGDGYARVAQQEEQQEAEEEESDGGGGGKYQELPADAAAAAAADVFPERRSNLVWWLTFGWMTPLMRKGFARPLTEADVWQLDSWDRTEAVYGAFARAWGEEKQRRNPLLLRALNRSLGARFWLGGLWKTGNDASQFVGPVFLNLLLQSMQQREPPRKGYYYAGCILVGTVLGVLAEGQYFQNVMRTGFRARSALVAAVFRKTLRLTHTARRRGGFTAGRINNLMTTDAEALLATCQQLHGLWSAPLRIGVAVALLYKQLGRAALLGSAVLLVMLPVQTAVIKRTQVLAREGLKATDTRIGIVHELLAAMDVVKCYVWEGSFAAKVGEVRAREIGWFRRAQMLAAVNSFILNSIPVLVTVVAFGAYALLGGTLTPAKAFTSLSLFTVLRFPLYMFPTLITQVVQANVSLRRLQELLLAEERELEPNPALLPGEPAISIRDGTFSWDNNDDDDDVDVVDGVVDGVEEEGKTNNSSTTTTTRRAPPPPATLSGVNLEVPAGRLVAVVGATGHGKTSLLSAILGEIPAASASGAAASQRTLRGTVAYVPQVSWIFNATVRDNILFGLPHDPARYARAVSVSALVHDLSLLPGGDLTEIGERGVNLSGGQRQRVALARAVYADADVYILDDPLSALDAHVGRHVFEACVLRELRGRGRTVVMATNQLHLLPQVDWVVVMRRGEVVEQGSFDELTQRGATVFRELMDSAAGTMEGGQADEEEQAAAGDHNLKEDGRDRSAEANGEVTTTTTTTPTPTSGKLVKAAGATPPPAASVLVKAEERDTGVISAGVLLRYQAAMGGAWVVVVLLFFYVATETIRLGSSAWLSVWTSPTSGLRHTSNYYNAVYALLSLSQVAVTLATSFWTVRTSLAACASLHDAMLHAILRAPMSFFHANPSGRIINRFAKDTGDIDRTVAQYASLFLGALFQLLSAFVLVGAVSALSLWAVLPLLLAFQSAYAYFQATAREAKRMDAITRSPVYAQFGEAVAGLASVRAYGAAGRVAHANGRAVDANTRFVLLGMSANRWLSVRLEVLGGLMIFATAVLAVLGNARASNPAQFAPQMGLLLSYALSITSLMTAALRLASMAETSFNAVERVGTYIDLPPEGQEVADKQQGRRRWPPPPPPPGWPDAGAIDFQDVVVRYRPDLPPVLDGLSFSIRPHEKVGVVGRTGAGKSSMMNALFRLVEASRGRILIDGLDTAADLALPDLRRQLGVIPQTPVLFTGTVRTNLDPFNEHSDGDLWEALERAHLKHALCRASGATGLGLDAPVTESGDNFSVGQRQLLSLARALLRRSKILVLDEATAAVDVATDALIQRTIRAEFRACTMLVVAHRLNTIIDCDRILVLDAGRVAELDSPAVLLARPDSKFAAMVRSTGAANARYLHQLVLEALEDRQRAEEQARAEEARVSAAAAALGRGGSAAAVDGVVISQEQEVAAARWHTAARWALAMSLVTNSHRELEELLQFPADPSDDKFNHDEDGDAADGASSPTSSSSSSSSSSSVHVTTSTTTVVERTHRAAQLVQEILLREHDDEIEEELRRRGVSQDQWWAALLRVVDGLGGMARHLRSQGGGGGDSSNKCSADDEDDDDEGERELLQHQLQQRRQQQEDAAGLTLQWLLRRTNERGDADALGWSVRVQLFHEVVKPVLTSCYCASTSATAPSSSSNSRPRGAAAAAAAPVGRAGVLLLLSSSTTGHADPACRAFMARAQRFGGDRRVQEASRQLEQALCAGWFRDVSAWYRRWLLPYADRLLTLKFPTRATSTPGAAARTGGLMNLELVGHRQQHQRHAQPPQQQQHVIGEQRGTMVVALASY